MTNASSLGIVIQETLSVVDIPHSEQEETGMAAYYAKMLSRSFEYGGRGAYFDERNVF